MLTARGVYVVRYPTLLEWTSRSQADQAIERDKGVRLVPNNLRRILSTFARLADMK